MKTWILRKLNADAKSWPYYKGDRAKQRQSIKNDLKRLREINASRYEDGTLGAYVTVAHCGGLSLSWRSEYGTAHLSGAPDNDLGFYIKLGVPCIDCRSADFGKLVRHTLRGWLVAMPGDVVDPTPGAFNRRPLSEHIAGHREVGSTIYNCNPPGWQEVDGVQLPSVHTWADMSEWIKANPNDGSGIPR